jgi:hypothetical protein
MMGFTADGQINAALVESRDRRFGVSSVSSEEKRADRARIQAPAIDPAADAWQHGKSVQVADPLMPR